MAQNPTFEDTAVACQSRGILVVADAREPSRAPLLREEFLEPFREKDEPGEEADEDRRPARIGVNPGAQIHVPSEVKR